MAKIRSTKAILLIVMVMIVAIAYPKVENFVHKKYLSYQLSSKTETAEGWVKNAGNPVLGGKLGTCFDVSVIQDEGKYKMWFSWRDYKSIAYTESDDGVVWSEPTIALGPDLSSRWEEDVNRPCVIKVNDEYLMWYTGQVNHRSNIGFAKSKDGIHWNKYSDAPVLEPSNAWEKDNVMCPYVIWDDDNKIFKMWYSGGEYVEPDSIGYATSQDGIKWDKYSGDPVFGPQRNNLWEANRVSAPGIQKYNGWYYMFYVGFANQEIAQIGVARSKDGIHDWERSKQNPIIRRGYGETAWDRDAVYRPGVLINDHEWRLWYNGRKETIEQIGLAIHRGLDLGF